MEWRAIRDASTTRAAWPTSRCSRTRRVSPRADAEVEAHEGFGVLSSEEWIEEITRFF
jgi:hypothetical protein